MDTIIPLLQPVFQGPLRPYGLSLVLAPDYPAHALPLSQLLTAPGLLAAQVQARAVRLRVDDLRPAASDWINRYLAALLPPLVAAAALLAQRFPAAPDDMALVLDDDGAPWRFYIRTLGDSLPGADAQQRYGPLLHQHLTPLFDALHQQSGLAQKIMWSHAVRWLEFLFDAAAPLADGHGGAIAALLHADRAWLLESAAWNGVANPLHMRRRRGLPAPGQIADADGLVALHSHCCLYHLLPDQGYCKACPLDPLRGGGIRRR